MSCIGITCNQCLVLIRTEGRQDVSDISENKRPDDIVIDSKYTYRWAGGWEDEWMKWQLMGSPWGVERRLVDGASRSDGDRCQRNRKIQSINVLFRRQKDNSAIYIHPQSPMK